MNVHFFKLFFQLYFDIHFSTHSDKTQPIKLLQVHLTHLQFNLPLLRIYFNSNISLQNHHLYFLFDRENI